LNAPAPHPGLGFGERLPDFRRHDATGAPRFAYDLADGRPWVLAALGSAEPALVAATRRALAARDVLDADVVRVLLVPVPPPRLAELVGPPDDALHTLADDGAVTRWLIGTREPNPALALFALDPNQRVAERIELGGPGELSRALTGLRDAFRALATAPGADAPVLVVPRVLEPALCDELIALFDREGGEPSGTLRLDGDKAELVADPRYKSRRDYQRFDPAWTGRLSDLLARRLLPEVDKCFTFRANTFEPFKLACYDAGEGGYHRPHRDNVTPDVFNRRFAVSINLNTGEYEGGALRFPEYGDAPHVPPRGGAIVFSSSMLHEATPVTRGRRFVLLTFLASDRERGQHLYHEPR
jgi:predicted 2-oxoglutarate/Fe(II)-dependent dioxygenase YbiX